MLPSFSLPPHPTPKQSTIQPPPPLPPPQKRKTKVKSTDFSITAHANPWHHSSNQCREAARYPRPPLTPSHDRHQDPLKGEKTQTRPPSCPPHVHHHPQRQQQPNTDLIRREETKLGQQQNLWRENRMAGGGEEEDQRKSENLEGSC